MASFDELNRILSASYTQQGSPNRGGTGNPGGVHNTSPRPTSPGAYDGAAYRNTYGTQNPQLGRYRPPTMGGDGSDPGNWNDSGGYAYNLPNNFGPAQTSWTYPGNRPVGPGGHSMDYYLDQGRQADRDLQAGLADGSVVASEVPNRDRPGTHTNYTRPGQQGGYASGSPEAYAQWQAYRNAMRDGGMQGYTPDITPMTEAERARMAAYAEADARGYGYPEPTGFDTGNSQFNGRGPASVGHTPVRLPGHGAHVGGPSAGKPPPTVNGGTKGPMPVEEQLAALEDWEFRRNRGRGNRWGRY